MNHPTLFKSEARARNGDPRLTVLDVDGFVYARRPGINSIAFILWDKNRPPWARVGLLNCQRNPTTVWAVRAFTGTLDVPPGTRFSDVVKMEVREEAGYQVEEEAITFVGSYEVSHQNDEDVCLYVVNVTGQGSTSQSNRMGRMNRILVSESFGGRVRETGRR